MRTDLLTLRADDPAIEAAAALEEYHLGAAPVVDALGHVVGVLSVHDIARQEHIREAPRGGVPAPTTAAWDDGEYGDSGFALPGEYSPELLGRACVADGMSSGVVGVPPDATLAEACSEMLERSVHRVFVLEGRRLVWVLSSWELVRLIAGETRAKGRNNL